MSLTAYLILFTLSLGGLIFLTCFASATAPIRVALGGFPRIGGFFRGLLYCPMCSGFWIGLVWGVFSEALPFPWWHSALLHAWAAIGVAHLWTSWTGGPIGYDAERAWLKGEAADASEETEKKDG